MTVQNVIYSPGDGLVFFSISKPGVYVTRVFAGRRLMELHEQLA